MSYENAVPKPLKFLISDGKMIDDEGNVIAESDTLKDLYTKWAPEVKKYLLSDGSVVDEEGNLIIKNEYYKKMYDQAIPKVAKYLHADGTVDENPGGGSADLEDNHQTTIDVSTYTQPVEVLPTSGKDGMKKNTITLNNIPSGSAGNVYCTYDAPAENDVVPEGEYVGTTIFDPDLGNRLFTIVGDGVKTVKELIMEMGGSSDYSWIYFTTCTNVIANEQEYAYEKLHLYYGYAD